MNQNLASLMSTAELRQLERQYANPKTPIQGLILRGIQSELESPDRKAVRELTGEEIEARIGESALGDYVDDHERD